MRANSWDTAGEELDDIFIGDAEIWCAVTWLRQLHGLGCRSAEDCTCRAAATCLCFLRNKHQGSLATLAWSHSLAAKPQFFVPHASSVNSLDIMSVSSACDAGEEGPHPEPTRMGNPTRTSAHQATTSWTSDSVRIPRLPALLLSARA